MLGPKDSEILLVTPEKWGEVKEDIMRIEQVFPNNIRDTEQFYETTVALKSAIFLVAKVDQEVVGYVIGAALENFKQIPGIKQDPYFGIGNTIYLESIAVASDYQGQGIGKHLRRHFILMAKKKGFSYIASHVPEGCSERWNGICLQLFPDWFGTGVPYEYFRRELEFGDWCKGCESMITVQTILAGFSAVILTVILTDLLPSMIPVSLVVIVAAIILFTISSERSTDALDLHSPAAYVKALIPYNFAVFFLLLGVAFTIFAYGAQMMTSDRTSSLPFTGAVIVTATVIPIISTYRWLVDGMWLMNRQNRLDYVASLKFGESM